MTEPQLNIHNDPITPKEEALLSTIQREFTNHEYVITETRECEDAHEKTIRRIADLLEFIHNYRQRTRIAIRDAKYAAQNQLTDALAKMEDEGLKDSEAYQKLRKVWMELSE